jgi:hypothetical protein
MQTRFLVLASILSAVAASAADGAAPYWVAICRGDKDANYTQTVGGDGAFSQGLGDGSYQTVPLKMGDYQPDRLVCGAVGGTAELAQVCADNDRQVIFLKLRDKKNPTATPKPVDYCNAAVKIH